MIIAVDHGNSSIKTEHYTFWLYDAGYEAVDQGFDIDWRYSL